MAQTRILLESGTNELELIEFYLDRKEPKQKAGFYRGHYAINVAKLLETIPKPRITEMPPSAADPAVLGLFKLRDALIPLIDLSRYLRKEIYPSNDQVAMVTHFNNVTCAFLVSGVYRIHRVSWSQVLSPGLALQGYSKDSFTGSVMIEDRIIFLLDLEKIVGELNPTLAINVDAVQKFTTGKAFNVLIADDSGMVRTMVKRALTNGGFEVHAHNDGQELWDRLLAIKDKVSQGARLADEVSLVISDIEMPTMDGHHLTLRIKQDPVLKDIPVFLFSSLITNDLRHKGEAVGADDQFTKPEIARMVIMSRILLEELDAQKPILGMSMADIIAKSRAVMQELYPYPQDRSQGIDDQFRDLNLGSEVERVLRRVKEIG